ncbi:MAG: putative glycoside hydrolase [Actinomycetota bacterium]|nr:putative glycoside hydrolase [Actinomycetota bacterium]
MARKRIFYDGKGRALFSSKRPEFSAIEFQETGYKRPRRQREGDVENHTGKAFSLNRTIVTIIFVIILVVAFLIWFFVFIYPSPIGKLNPAPQSFVNNKEVKVSISLSRKVELKNIQVKIDGKDISETAAIRGKTISCASILEDGRHEAYFKIKTAGIMGGRAARWNFSVDTSPPAIHITSKKIEQSKDSPAVKVLLRGKTEPGATVSASGKKLSVNEKGLFSSIFESSKSRSIEISAIDRAGNVNKTYIVTQKQTKAKGAHVSIYIASSNSSLQKLIDLVDRTELNSLEIDLKDESGLIAFEIDNETAKSIGSTEDYIELEQCVDKLRYHGIYTICRIVVFKDPKLAKGCPSLAVHDTSGNLWGNSNWVDPYSKEVWDYNLNVAEAAARAGFHEIQFDYVRFPSDGNTSTCVYPHKDERTPRQVISDFLNYTRNKLAPYNVFVSADIFGLTASKQGEMGIGQSVSELAKNVDYISPMVYPSHYNPGEYNIKSPENNPGDIVTKSLKDFRKTVKGTQAKIRPWLQDFSLRVTYTSEMVRRQIDATEKLGIGEWLLWDPECTYTESALKQAKE